MEPPKKFLMQMLANIVFNSTQNADMMTKDRVIDSIIDVINVYNKSVIDTDKIKIVDFRK